MDSIGIRASSKVTKICGLVSPLIRPVSISPTAPLALFPAPILSVSLLSRITS